jgi:predicted Zn-dependent peptidase
MNKKLKQFIANKGFTEQEIARMSQQLIKEFRFEYNYLKRIGMVE